MSSILIEKAWAQDKHVTYLCDNLVNKVCLMHSDWDLFYAENIQTSRAVGKHPLSARENI